MAQPGLVVLLLAYLAFVSLGLPDTVFGVAWPSLQRAFGIPPSMIGAFLGSGVAGYFLSGLLAGTAVARLGVGGVLTVSSALVATALVGFAFAPAWVVFFPFAAVAGLGSGAIDAGLNGYAARHFSVRHLNWLHGCWGIGASIGPAVMTLMIARGHGYRAGYALLGAVLGSMALLFLVTRGRWGDAPRTDIASAVTAGSAADNDSGARAPAPIPGPETLRTALSRGAVWLQVLIFFLYAGVEATIGQWCFSWLRERRGFAIEAAGSWTAAYWASLTVGRIVLGGLVDRVGADRLLRVATIGAVLGVALLTSLDGLPGCLGLLLLGASLAPMFPTLVARTPARVGDGLAHHVVGLQVSAATLGTAVWPSAVGFLVATQGLGAVGAVSLVVAAALLLAHELLLARGGRMRPASVAE